MGAGQIELIGSEMYRYPQSGSSNSPRMYRKPETLKPWLPWVEKVCCTKDRLTMIDVWYRGIFSQRRRWLFLGKRRDMGKMSNNGILPSQLNKVAVILAYFQFINHSLRCDKKRHNTPRSDIIRHNATFCLNGLTNTVYLTKFVKLID